MHFGALCTAGTSHASAATTIGRELRRRGHRFTVFAIPDVEPLASSEGVEFCPVGVEDYPPGSFREYSETVTSLTGLEAVRFNLAKMVAQTKMILREAPGPMYSRGIDALLVDQVEGAGSTLAQHLGIPFITICNATAGVPDPSVPPTYTPWQPSDHFFARLRNRAVFRAFDLCMAPVVRAINQSREQWGLTPIRSFYESTSPWAVISQQTPDLDFPYANLPRQFHYIGLLHRSVSTSVPFPFDRVDGRPLVYATLGTIFSQTDGLFFNLARASQKLNVQLAITPGGKGDVAQYRDLPGDPIVVHKAPQLAVLRRASLTFCHGGNNTVLESLAAGVPLLVMPFSADQPGNGARLIRCGAGDVVPSPPSYEQLYERLQHMLNERRYREYKERAQVVGRSIERAGGERRAADIIEEAVNRGPEDSRTEGHQTPRGFGARIRRTA